MKAAVTEMVQIARLNQQMDERGLDAIVARAGINFTYLSGVVYPGTLARHVDLSDAPRAVYLVWPRLGEPHIVLNVIAEGLARRDSWVEYFDTYEGYVERPIERLVRTLDDMGLAQAKVGFEKDYINAADWEFMCAQLPSLRPVDSTVAMEHVRNVKLPAEIALLKQGADILDDAFLENFQKMRPGMRERDLHAGLMASCLAGGAEFVHGILNSSRNTLSYGGESDFVFNVGDAIRTDYVSYRKGYPGHQSRCAVIGKPTDEQRREYAVIRKLYLAAADQLRPGKTAGDVYQFVAESFAAQGLTYTSMLAGHGVGSWWHQQEPVISRGNPRVLEEGMVIAMEPHTNHWHIQDMFVIRADGVQLLSDKFLTEEIFVCG